MQPTYIADCYLFRFKKSPRNKRNASNLSIIDTSDIMDQRTVCIYLYMRGNVRNRECSFILPILNYLILNRTLVLHYTQHN
jgi:hypothetical protein